jgi:hypothetical protein
MNSRRFRANFKVFVAFILAFVLAGSTPPVGQSATLPDNRQTEIIAPGIEHIEIRRGNFTPGTNGDRWIIHILWLDPARARLDVARAMDEAVGTETVSSLAARHGAVAGVNGGYFRTTGLYKGEPTGLLAFGARVWSEPSPRRTALAVSNKGGRIRAAVTAVDFTAALEAEDGASCPVNGVDRPREADELIVFGPEFHRTTLTGSGGIEVVVNGQAFAGEVDPQANPGVPATVDKYRVAAVSDGAGSQPIPSGGYVVSATGRAAAWVRAHLKLGSTVRLRTELKFDPSPPFEPEFLLGAGPRLVAAGAAAGDPSLKFYPADFANNRHPRTAAGFRKDSRLALVTVDGRQPAKSVGMTIAELSALMLELGCDEAINLDGGGSTTMVVNGKVVNSPSDAAGERAVSDALLVIKK